MFFMGRVRMLGKNFREKGDRVKEGKLRCHDGIGLGSGSVLLLEVSCSILSGTNLGGLI